MKNLKTLASELENADDNYILELENLGHDYFIEFVKDYLQKNKIYKGSDMSGESAYWIFAEDGLQIFFDRYDRYENFPKKIADILTMPVRNVYFEDFMLNFTPK